MKHLRLLLSFCILVLLAGVVIAQDDDMVMMGDYESCATPENLPETVTIGAIFGLSGDISVYGGVQQQGVDLAVQQINEAGYLGEGVTLAVQYEDAVSADDAINAMTRLIEEAGVPAVLGPTLSTHAFAADPIAQENSVPVMGVSNTASGITDMGDFVFRDSLPESSVIPGTIAQSAEILGYTSVGVLYGDDDDFTLSGYEVFIDALDANGIEILGEETFARGDVDFNAQLSNLLASEPEVLVVSALAAEGVQIILQARDLGYDGPIIGGNGLNSPAIIENAGEAAEGVIVGAAWNSVSDNPLSVQFVADFEAAYEASPDQFATQAYTGAWLMATAIRCADSVDPVAIRDALAATEGFASPLGDFSFAEDRNPIHDPVVQVVEMGAFGVLGAEMDDMSEPEMESTEESDG